VAGSLDAFASAHLTHGAQTQADGSVTVTEWVPGASYVEVIGDFNDWGARGGWGLEKDDYGTWTGTLAPGTLVHGARWKLRIHIPDRGFVDRFSAWARQARQEPGNVNYDQIHWSPPADETYAFHHPRPTPRRGTDGRPAVAGLRIYECHVGMAGEDGRVHTYDEFRINVLPRVIDAGYDTLQIMAIQEHVYYASFGYHVTSPFAVSSRQGSPEEFKRLVDACHAAGIRVLLDLVHSHASKNADDGVGGMRLSEASSDQLGMFRPGIHPQWDSLLFDYGKLETLRYLLSNVRYWLTEFNLDGFRFDGVTSMLYTHHGAGVGFSGNYSEYFGPNSDVEATTYLMLASEVADRCTRWDASQPESERTPAKCAALAAEAADGTDGAPMSGPAILIAEDVSGRPGLCRPVREGGVGFHARLGMAAPDFWIKLLKEVPDEHWGMMDMVKALCNRRYTETTVGYTESHDQALVGDKTQSMWLFGIEIYTGMSLQEQPWASPVIERGMRLHGLIRAAASCMGGEAYLAFMGNEFGHPEWLDFPREGNGWSFHHCRRQWHLQDDINLRYHLLGQWDRELRRLESTFGYLADGHQMVTCIDDERKIIVVERGPLVWVFNWNVQHGVEGLQIGAGSPGRFRVVLDSTEERFGGQHSWKVGAGFEDRADHNTIPGEWAGRGQSMRVRSPARSVVAYADADLWAGAFPSLGRDAGVPAAAEPTAAATTADASVGATSIGVSEYGLSMPADRVDPIVSDASADENRASAQAWIAKHRGS